MIPHGTAVAVCILRRAEHSRMRGLVRLIELRPELLDDAWLGLGYIHVLRWVLLDVVQARPAGAVGEAHIRMWIGGVWREGAVPRRLQNRAKGGAARRQPLRQRTVT